MCERDKKESTRRGLPRERVLQQGMAETTKQQEAA